MKNTILKRKHLKKDNSENNNLEVMILNGKIWQEEKSEKDKFETDDS